MSSHFLKKYSYCLYTTPFPLLILTIPTTSSNPPPLAPLLASTTTVSGNNNSPYLSPSVVIKLSPSTLALTLPNPVALYMDIGSDLVWFPCAPFECILYEEKSNPSLFPKPPNISRTLTISCKSPTFSVAHTSLPSSNLCEISRCPLDLIQTSDYPPFYYAYRDGSLIDRLYHDSFAYLFMNDFEKGMEEGAGGAGRESNLAFD